MIKHSFSLIPFPAPNIPKLNIIGTVARQSNVLNLQYSLTGDVKEVIIPLPLAQPGRKDELWKTTCFEFFLAIPNQQQYWEFNMSPSGDWNAYHMDAYRRIGFREEGSIQRLDFEAQEEAGALVLDAAVDLTTILPANAPIEIGVTTVIQTRDGSETYWALSHPAPQPDFHLRESFILALAGQTHPSRQPAPGN